jgi:hypothetical protein
MSLLLCIFDVRGRVVRKLAVPGDGSFDPGVHTLHWRGNTDAGRPAASGVYFYRLKAGGRIATRKLVLLR